MCGLISLYSKNFAGLSERTVANFMQIASSMLDTLQMRGPDERSLVQVGSVILGHTRLSIIDLYTGSQPIYNEDKTVAVLLNGEIYNFHELRSELEKDGHCFQTATDTEVIVHLYEKYGESVFSKLNGMFAIVIYDIRLNILLAARDRVGEKPLLYWESNGIFVVASEIKALLKIPDIEKSIDINAIALYLSNMYIPAPISIFKNIKKLQPSHYLKVDGETCKIKKYWNPSEGIDWNLKENEINEQFLELFADAVKIRSYSDVPFGVFLSGGIDSSAVTAIMAKNHSDVVRTFTVGFTEEVDERPYARMVANQYQTDHTELLIDQRVEDVLEEVLSYFDEPFGDSSAIPTYLVSREARKHVKVILTGDGGDELFAGYGSYIDQKYQIGGKVGSRFYKILNQFTLKYFGKGLLENCYPKATNYTKAFDHWRWVRTIFNEKQLNSILYNQFFSIEDYFRNQQWLNTNNKDALSASYSFDLNYYLPDDLLKKVDMSSMLASLECRAPFLDYRLVEFSLKIPPQLKVKNDCLKYLLKSSLSRSLPKEILQRPKIGFGAPIESWLKNSLKDMVLMLLAPGCKAESYLDRKAIQYYINLLYSDKVSGEYRLSQKVWLLLILEIWMRKYL